MEKSSETGPQMESRTSSDTLLNSPSMPANDVEKWTKEHYEQRMTTHWHPQKTYATIARWGLISILWLTSVIVTAAWFSTKTSTAPYSYETGFDTDLPAIRPFIELKKVKFTGGIKFDENGTTYRGIEPGVQYVGEPSDSIDRAWKELIRGEGIDLIGDEAEGFVGKTYQKDGIYWFTGADVFHQLHCVNMLRRNIRPDYYKPWNPEPLHTDHLYHCVDYLRQAVQCSADLTPLPFGWSDKRDRILQVQETVHTCRNFDLIHKWSRARDANAHPVHGM